MTAADAALEPGEIAERLDSAVADAFALMLGLECGPVEVGAGEGGKTLTAAIFFSGPLKGEFLLRVSPGVGMHLAGVMLGAPCEAGDPMLADALGELGNIIAGGWKSKLAAGLACCLMSIPSVSRRGPGAPAGGQGVRRTYGFEGFEFEIDLCLG